MPNEYVPLRRTVPLCPTAALAEATQEDRALKGAAPAHSNVQQPEVPSPEDYTISVDHVREHLQAKGLSKSKDTIQRWCRNGDLDCQKRGVLQRYFTTEASLQRLEQKLLPDMIASDAGARMSSSVLQSAAPAVANANSSMHLQETEDAGESSSTQAKVGVEIPPHTGEVAGEPAHPPAATAIQSRLEAENEGLRALLESRERHIAFLEEEVRAGREQRGAVVQISNRMLETLETIAVGGRLERPRPSANSEVFEREPEGMNSDRL